MEWWKGGLGDIRIRLINALIIYQNIDNILT